ncbi:PREDICTED: peroxiredoxin-5, mitochondrial-like [Amphimedon queenslandica]|uniref:Peroxiredoxin-5 n=1 Tax=Amphimedon queenslandica TaxID=400682 RepID=A0A1X7VEM2_AMPQE|nr:PREDICTED: peroxiredoxin-5, mitochondrial-like [Amphimedon queenslandica]|eukprot:XP_003384607.1 PREDICTED: peroxiredoxin-5, mitochondrial-like [Amphimedon queenslandica]
MFSRHFSSRLLFFTRGLRTTASLKMPIQVGQTLPSIELHEGTPKDKVNILELFKGKKGILFAVPGAFTPGCSQTHLPGYVNDYLKLKAKGFEVIACVSVNDAFVMSAWGIERKATGKIRMLADPAGEFTKAVDLGFDATPALGNIRSKRYAMTIEDGVVKSVAIEPDATGLTVSLSCSILNE